MFVQTQPEFPHSAKASEIECILMHLELAKVIVSVEKYRVCWLSCGCWSSLWGLVLKGVPWQHPGCTSLKTGNYLVNKLLRVPPTIWPWIDYLTCFLAVLHTHPQALLGTNWFFRVCQVWSTWFHLVNLANLEKPSSTNWFTEFAEFAEWYYKILCDN